MNRSVPLLALLIGATLLSGASCQDDENPCGGCFSRFALYLRPSASDANARFDPGTYSLDAVVDGVDIACNFTIIADRTAHYDCGVREILAGTEVVFLTFPGTPDLVEITLSAGDSPVYSDTFAPIYAASGSGVCDPPCEAASEDVFILP